MSRSGGCGVGTGSPRASREPEACVSPAAGAAEVGLSVSGQGFPLGAVRYGSEEEAGCKEAMNQPVICFHAQELCFPIRGDRHMKGTLRRVVASLGKNFRWLCVYIQLTVSARLRNRTSKPVPSQESFLF